MNAPVDNSQRLAALNPLRSICVTAPAGSGKTELLSQRVLKLLAGADQPEEILAITFTRKAAAEMHHRIIKALRDAQSTAEANEPHKRLSWQLAKDALARDKLCGWRLLDNTGRLKIQTIDSLCASLTRQMPILSNFGAQPKITNKPEQCYRAAVHEFLKMLEQDNYFATDLAELFRHVDNDMGKIERLLMTLLQRRDQWLHHIGMGANVAVAKQRLEHTLDVIIIDVLQQIDAELADIAPELLPLLDYAGDNLSRAHSDSIACQLMGIVELPEISSAALPQWRCIAELLLTRTGEWRKTVNVSSGFPTQTHDGDKVRAKALKANFIALLKSLHGNTTLQQLLVELRYLPDATFDQQQWQLLESLTRLLPALVAQLTLVFQQQGEVDYSQISMAALQALGDHLDPTELAMKLDYQLKHILVDEFQDTASTQFRLLERLIEGWAEHNVVNPQQPNTVFIVGDGMQSIYGFREANVGLFLEARNKGINGILLQDLPLTVNFRSDPAVVDWINQTFDKAFPPVENLSRGAVPFEQAVAFKAASESSDIQVLGFSGDQARQQEAEKVVELVRQAKLANPNGSIAILVRSRSHLSDIIPALTAADIPWNATDIDPLASYSAIIDLLSLTKALFNIADQISWCALLRSPWVGLSNKDLHSLLGNSQQLAVWSAINDEQRIASLSKFGRSRLEAIRPILVAALANRNRQPARSWVEGVWLAIGGAAMVNSEDEFGFVDDYFDLLESYQQGESLTSLREFEQAVLRLYAAPATVDTGLQVMTIHKAKGLEFDTVILPALARAPRSDDRSLLMWREYLSADGSDRGMVISPLGATGSEEDKIYQYLRYEQAQTSLLENTRLFYVAATRAVKQLYLLLDGSIDEKTGEAKPPSSSSLISAAWPAFKESVNWAVQAAANNEQYGFDFVMADKRAAMQRLQSSWSAPVWSFTNPLEQFYLNNNSLSSHLADEDNTPDLSTDVLPQCIGTVTHWILEILVERSINFWLTMDEAVKNNWLQRLLHHHALPPALQPTAIIQVKTAVDNTVGDAEGRWVLSDQYEYSATELEIFSSYGNNIRRKVIDRCFIDDDGALWIVDYKTAPPQHSETKAEFIARESALYSTQLLDYKMHLASLFPAARPIRVALYFTFYPCLHELIL
ncbi:MAG: UvrD-helicase domain-containing protein [Spongiibacteraceae bacterium]